MMGHMESTWKFASLMVLPSLLLLVATIGPSGAESDPWHTLGPGEAQSLIRENAGNRDFVVLDVRTPGEFAKGHIEGAVLVDFRSPGFREKMAGLDKSKSYLVYCRTGNRSDQALHIMKELEFKSLYHLEGGIKRWVEDGMPAVR